MKSRTVVHKRSESGETRQTGKPVHRGTSNGQCENAWSHRFAEGTLSLRIVFCFSHSVRFFTPSDCPHFRYNFSRKTKEQLVGNLLHSPATSRLSALMKSQSLHAYQLEGTHSSGHLTSSNGLARGQKEIFVFAELGPAVSSNDSQFMAKISLMS